MAAFKLVPFCRDERGALSLEALFWLVLVVLAMAIFVDGTSMFSAQGRMLRIVQDANRAYSLGFLKTTDDVQNYVDTRLALHGGSVSTTSTVSGDMIFTSASAPAADFEVFGLFPAFNGLKITAKADHMIEPS